MKFSLKKFIPVAVVVMMVSTGSHSAIAAITNIVYGGAALTFRPANVTINAGDTVVWSNASGVHNVVGTTAGTPLCGCAGTSIPGFTNTFNVPGDYLYQCSFHAGFGMTGIVHVASTGNPILTNATAVFTNHSFIFTITNTANHTNIVQAATDLAGANWVPLLTNFSSTNGFRFTDTNAVFSNRFYRVVQP
jgi:plastocyanin